MSEPTGFAQNVEPCPRASMRLVINRTRGSETQSPERNGRRRHRNGRRRHRKQSAASKEEVAYSVRAAQAAVGLFVGLMLGAAAMLELSRHIRRLTRFTHDIFACFVCSIYVYEGVSSMFKRFAGNYPRQMQAARSLAHSLEVAARPPGQHRRPCAESSAFARMRTHGSWPEPPGEAVVGSVRCGSPWPLGNGHPRRNPAPRLVCVCRLRRRRARWNALHRLW